MLQNTFYLRFGGDAACGQVAAMIGQRDVCLIQTLQLTLLIL